jgi:ribosomal protein S27E
MIAKLRKIMGYEQPKEIGGNFIPVKDDEGYNKCPNCGDSKSISIKDFLDIKCNTCEYRYLNYGVWGWKLVSTDQPVNREERELCA